MKIITNSLINDHMDIVDKIFTYNKYILDKLYKKYKPTKIYKESEVLEYITKLISEKYTWFTEDQKKEQKWSTYYTLLSGSDGVFSTEERNENRAIKTDGITKEEAHRKWKPSGLDTTVSHNDEDDGVGGKIKQFLGYITIALLIIAGITSCTVSNSDDGNNYTPGVSGTTYYKPCENEFYECTNICDNENDPMECMGPTGDLDAGCSFDDCVGSCMNNKGC